MKKHPDQFNIFLSGTNSNPESFIQHSSKNSKLPYVNSALKFKIKTKPIIYFFLEKFLNRNHHFFFNRLKKKTFLHLSALNARNSKEFNFFKHYKH